MTPKGAEAERVFAFAAELDSSMPVGGPKLGYKWRLKSFEKAPRAHILSIKYDPFNGAFIAWYFGGIGLMGALVFVFSFLASRVWALVEPEGKRMNVTLAGETNRNHQGFKDRFDKIVHDLKSPETHKDKEV